MRCWESYVNQHVAVLYTLLLISVVLSRALDKISSLFKQVHADMRACTCELTRWQDLLRLCYWRHSESCTMLLQVCGLNLNIACHILLSTPLTYWLCR